MKKSIFTVFILCGFISLNSFREHPNSKKTLKNEEKNLGQLAVSATKMNILYIGLDNPLDIAVSNENSNLISVETDNGTIVKKSNSEWIARVVSTGQTTIKVYIEKNGQKQLYGEKIFRTLRVPDPVLSIDGKKEMSISKESLLKNPKLNVVLENFMYDADLFSISSFTLKINDKNTLKEAKCVGTTFSDEALELVKATETESMIYFDEIKISGPGNSIRKMQPIALRIK